MKLSCCPMRNCALLLLRAKSCFSPLSLFPSLKSRLFFHRWTDARLSGNWSLGLGRWVIPPALFPRRVFTPYNAHASRGWLALLTQLLSAELIIDMYGEKKYLFAHRERFLATNEQAARISFLSFIFLWESCPCRFLRLATRNLYFCPSSSFSLSFAAVVQWGRRERGIAACERKHDSPTSALEEIQVVSSVANWGRKKIIFWRGGGWGLWPGLQWFKGSVHQEDYDLAFETQ